MIKKRHFVKQGAAAKDASHEVIIWIKQLNLDLLESEVLERATPGNDKYQVQQRYNIILLWCSNFIFCDANIC